MRSRRLPSLVAAVAVLCLGASSCRKAPSGASKNARGGIFTVDVLTIQPRAHRETLSATGSLLARESVNLQAETAGIVREIQFEEGRPVKRGEVLVVMDASELEAQLARVRAQLELTSTVEARQRDLLKSKGISQTEYEQSEANLHMAQAEEKLLQAQLAKRRIIAPFDGVAGLRQVSLGTYLTPGMPICTFADITALKIDFSLPERYLAHVKTGQEVSFRVSGRAEAFSAVISAIEPSIDVATRSMMIRATVPNDDHKLLPGSFAELQVTLEEISDAILIPPIALVPGLKQQSVFVHRDGVVEERKVQPGLRTSDAVQIVEGLSPGDELITTGVLQLRSGMKVQVKRRADSPPAATASDAAGSSPGIPRTAE